MRILLVAPMVPQEDGAGAIPVLLYAELVGLRERHDVSLVTAVGDEPGEEQAVARLAREGVDVHLADRRQPPPGLRRWRRRWQLAAAWMRRGWPWRTVWFAAPAVQAVLDRLAATRTFDVVAVEDDAMSVFRLPAGVPAVLTEHEVLRPRAIDWRPGTPPGWPRWALRELDWRRWENFQRAAWSRFDRVQVFSQRDAEAIAELAPDVGSRVRVNPFGLVLPPAADPDREVPGSLLFVGNFTHPPNCDAAVWLAREIMPGVKARHAAARLRIVGTAPPREVRELAGSDVEVIADVPSVRPHLEAACVVLAPVRSGGGMRMKVLHAIASGKAVVTTTRGAEGYGDDPPFAVADDTEGIAERAARLLGDERARRELGERARAFAEKHHSPAAWAARLEAIYEEAHSEQSEVAHG
ncbi:MAG: glycosyltransferase family 4 protein [Actinomycetota bacterium]